MAPYRLSIDWLVERAGREVEIEVSGRFVPGCRGGHLQPDEQPTIEDVRGWLGGREFLLSDEEEDQATDALCEALPRLLEDEGPDHDD